jgi:hypothetical protein
MTSRGPERRPPLDETEHHKYVAPLLTGGFTVDPPGYERLSRWTHMLMNLVSARANFECARRHPAKRIVRHVAELGAGSSRQQRALFNTLQHQAFLVAGIMAYGRCYASSGAGIPTLNAKQVYQGSRDMIGVHKRLIELRNTIAAHTDNSDLVRLTLAVKDDGQRIVVRHIATMLMPLNEIQDFVEAVKQTEQFVELSLQKYLVHLEKEIGKPVVSA